MKPSDTRWLSHEHCVRAIYRELPALIVTLQQLYETTGDAEAYSIDALLATCTGVASIVFLPVRSSGYPGKDECFDAKKATRFEQVTSTSENHNGSTRVFKG